MIGSAARGLTFAGSSAAIALALHAVVNLTLLRRPFDEPPPVTETVSVLVPARDEAANLGALLDDLSAQLGAGDLEVLVLDDDSADATGDIARRHALGDRRFRVLDGSGPAPGWLGKPAACARLAEAARGSVLLFVDADVRLAPHAVAATVGLLRRHRLDLVSPYPRQEAVGALERLVQPLLQWSWASTLPLRWAEWSSRPSLSAANGQLLAVDAGTYRRAGGHAAVADQVLDDLALLRAVKAVGGRGGVVDGTGLASCRMYTTPRKLVDGYSKSLWSATGSPAAAVAVGGVLTLTYLVPPVAALLGSRVGLVGYVAGVAGRAAVARRTGGRVLPDAAAHPVSVAALLWLGGRSWRGHRRGTLTWKGRALP